MADREQLLKELNEISFTVNDLNLYLDTHPLDGEALDAFAQANERRTRLLSDYASEFGPLTVNCVCPKSTNRTGCCTRYPDQKHFTWIDGPLPWEGGI